MAKCPNCGFKLKIWHVKAECPQCKVNIPNFDWVNRLEQDSIVAEAAYSKMRQNIARLKYAFVGSRLRIARLPLTILPLFSFLLPLFNVSFNLPFFAEDKTFNLVGLIKLLPDITLSVIPDYLSSPVLGGATFRLLATVALIFISLISLIPVGLGFLIANYKHLNSKGLFFSNLFAVGCMLTSGFLFTSFSTLQQASTVNAFTLHISYGLYIGTALFLASAIINLAVANSKTDSKKLDEKIALAAATGKTTDKTEDKTTDKIDDKSE
jgi:hypothetical protein